MKNNAINQPWGERQVPSHHPSTDFHSQAQLLSRRKFLRRTGSATAVVAVGLGGTLEVLANTSTGFRLTIATTSIVTTSGVKQFKTIYSWLNGPGSGMAYFQYNTTTNTTTWVPLSEVCPCSSGNGTNTVYSNAPTDVSSVQGGPTNPNYSPS